MFDFIKNISPTEIVIIVLILVVLFGTKAILGLARTSGKTVKGIKKVKTEFIKAIEEDDDDKSSKS